MKIIMNETRLGAIDGIKTVNFEKGKEYSSEELGGLLDPWLEMGVCSSVVKPEKQVIDREDKEKAVIKTVSEKQKKTTARKAVK